MQTVNIKNIDNKHSEWIKSLGFYKDELILFKEKLREIGEKNTSKEVMQMIEHFQNQFLIQSESTDILQHDINVYVGKIANEALQHAGHVDGKEVVTHIDLEEKFQKHTSIFKGLKEEFMKFLSKVM